MVVHQVYRPSLQVTVKYKTPEIVNKTISKGEFIEQLFQSGSIAYYLDTDTSGISNTFKDIPKTVALGETATAIQDRSQYMTLIANPKKGVPVRIGRVLMGANKAGMTIKPVFMDKLKKKEWRILPLKN